MKSVFKVVLAILLLTSLGLNSAQGQLEGVADPDGTELVSSSIDAIVFDVEVPWQELSLAEVNLAGEQYIQVSLPGYSDSSNPGAPILPILIKNLAVPVGVELVVHVQPGRAHTFDLKADILPESTVTTLFDLPKDGGHYLVPHNQAEIVRDPAIYDSSDPYPDTLGQVSNDGILRQQRVAGIALHPVQFHPQEHTVTLYESLHVVVEFRGISVLPTRAAALESPAIEALLTGTLLNYKGSSAWRLPIDDMAENQQVLPGNTPQNNRAFLWAPPDPGWRVVVKQNGLYRLTYNDLLAAGLEVDSLDPTTLRLFHLGSEVAVFVAGEGDGSFDSQDSLVFYGQGIDSKYTDGNVYWLTYGLQSGLRMTSRDVTPSVVSIPLSYPAVLRIERNQWYINNAPGDENLERFLWEFVSGPGDWTFNFELSEPFDGSGSLSMSMLGYTSMAVIPLDHHAIIKLNGSIVADRQWDGKTWEEFTMELPEGTLLPGSNTLQVVLPNDLGASYDAMYVDWVKLSFARDFMAVSDMLEFSFDQPGTWLFQVEGFTGGDLDLYDVSDPYQVASLSGFEVVLAGSSYQLTFKDDVSATTAYWAGSPGNYLAVSSIEQDTPSTLRSTSNAADYILITPEIFADQAAVLAAYRSGQGLRSVQVDLQDIYDEFSYGVTEAKAIRDFLSFAYQNWTAPAPTYVVLVGGGHYDPKDHFGFGRESYLPPYLAPVDYRNLETVADNQYVAIVGEDNLPDMLIGRLAVNTTAEAAAMIAKIKAYEQSPADGSWKRQIVAVADNADAGGNFPASSQALLSCCLPSHYTPEPIYLGITHSTVSVARTALLDGFNSGRVLINFIGHAANNVWTGYDDNPNLSGYLLTLNDVGNLSNSDKYPVILGMTCNEGYFINPQVQGGNYDALAEVITKAGGKGAVASWSSSGFGLTTGHSYLDQGFFDSVFKNMDDTLGQATLAGKIRLWASGDNLFLVDTFLLFGDPATRFLRGLMAVDDNYQVDEDQVLSVPVLSGALANDIDPQNDILSAQLIADAQFGDLQFNADGSFAYTPAPDFYGSDSFTYRVNGMLEVSNTATVRLTINPVNDPPVAINQEVYTYTNIPLAIILTASDDSGGIISRSSGDGSIASLRDGLIFEVLNAPSHGSLNGTAPELVYTPHTAFTGTDSFTFKVNDGEYDSTTATVSIQIYPGFQVYLPLITR